MVHPPPTEKSICIRCKGARLLCGKKTCPILKKTSILKSVLPFELGKSLHNINVFGPSPPGFFVGRYNYPKVFVGPLVPFKEYVERLNLSDFHILDAPELWYGKQSDDIISYRSSLVRSNFKIDVKSAAKDKKTTPSLHTQRLLETSQELSMAARPVDTETHLEKLNLNIIMDNHALPLGPSGITKKIRITENVRVHPKVEYCVSDTDLKASEAIGDYLFLKGRVPFSTIQRIFSAGLLGEEKKRRLVPTRWSITAIDDIISKRLIKEIKKFPEINNFQIFESTYLDNHFKILLFPGKFLYEMNEVWAPNSLWNISLSGEKTPLQPQIASDMEFYHGRKNYASNITGAYYSARKSICEYLYKIKRQARVLVFREVSAGYTVPLGVWVIRETVKNAMDLEKPLIIDNFDTALKKMSEGLMVDLKYWKKYSTLINFIKTQKTIDSFF